MSKTDKGFLPGAGLGILITLIAFSFLMGRSANDESGSVAGGNKKVRTLKMAHGSDTKHPVHLAMLAMKDKLEALSGGQLKLDIYPSSSLAPEPKCVEMVQAGDLDMVKSSASPMEAFIPELSVFSLPYVFRDSSHFWTVLDSSLGKELLDQGVSKNLKGLCYFDGGSRSFYTKDKMIKTPADLKGVKIRVQSSETAIGMVKALGATPQAIPFGELYTALQQGVVDGAENNPPSYFTNRHHEVCKYYSLDGHARIPDMLFMSTKTWESLSEQEKAWIVAASEACSQVQRNLWKQKTKEALAQVKKEGVEIYTPDQKLFFAKVKPMLDAKKGTPVGELLEQIEGM